MKTGAASSLPAGTGLSPRWVFCPRCCVRAGTATSPPSSAPPPPCPVRRDPPFCCSLGRGNAEAESRRFSLSLSDTRTPDWEKSRRRTRCSAALPSPRHSPVRDGRPRLGGGSVPPFLSCKSHRTSPSLVFWNPSFPGRRLLHPPGLFLDPVHPPGADTAAGEGAEGSPAVSPACPVAPGDAPSLPSVFPICEMGVIPPAGAACWGEGGKGGVNPFLTVQSPRGWRRQGWGGITAAG